MNGTSIAVNCRMDRLRRIKRNLTCFSLCITDTTGKWKIVLHSSATPLVRKKQFLLFFLGNRDKCWIKNLILCYVILLLPEIAARTVESTFGNCRGSTTVRKQKVICITAYIFLGRFSHAHTKDKVFYIDTFLDALASLRPIMDIN